MRIGIIHSQYRSSIPSGENKTVEDIAGILSKKHDVSLWNSNSDSLMNSARLRMKRAFEIILHDPANTNFEKWIKSRDSLQIHNYFPALSLSNLDTLARSSLPITRVVHNYRKTCLAGNHFRKDRECYKCLNRSFIPGIIRGCYNSSASMSNFVSIYSKAVEYFESKIEIKYIAISPIIRDYLISCGVDEKRITIISNSTPAENQISQLATDCIYIGRIEKEKGIFELIEMWRKHSDLPMLHIVGSGSRTGLLQDELLNINNIHFHGPKYGAELSNINQNAKVAVFPTLWREPFGRVVVEALSRGQAIASSKQLTHLEAIDDQLNGQYFDLTHQDMFEKISNCLKIDSKLHIKISRDKWLAHYSPDIVANKWYDYYRIDKGN